MSAVPQSADLVIADAIADCYADPLQHVLISYPWGKAGTSLEHFAGPDEWATKFLIELGRQVKERRFDGHTAVDPIRFSVASGHGIGKSAMTAWLIRWLLDRALHTRIIVTAGTRDQLRTRTWPELSKWHQMGLTKHWYSLTSGSGSLSLSHNSAPITWRADAQTSEKENSESFAGLHNVTGTVAFIFDEASQIDHSLFDVREGAMSDGEPFSFDFGNPTRSSGRFYENMVGRFKHRFTRYFVDSREVKITNKRQIQEWVDAYGDDSDFVRVRVKGEFPKTGSSQFINADLVDACAAHPDIDVQPFDPVVIGVDVARFGDDRSVILARRGRDCTIHRQMYSGLDTMQVAAHTVQIAQELRADAVFIDGGGVGGGVVDRCRQLGLDCMEVNFGARSPDARYANMATYMWAALREAMQAGIKIEDDPDLRYELSSREYLIDAQQRLVLERKQDLKKRGLPSPDIADALALTFAMPVVPSRAGYRNEAAYEVGEHEYDPFSR